MENAIPVVNSTVNQQKEKLDSVTLVPPGFHPARCYSVVDLGFQHSAKYNKWSQKIEYVFEILDHRQKFYADDTEERPSVSSRMLTNSMGKTSSLRKFAANAFGKTLNDQEAESFNIFSFADKTFMVQIVHSSPDKDGKVYENIEAIAPFNPAMVSPNANMAPHNDLLCFHIGTHGFNTKNFAFLPNFKRQTIMKSQEAMDHQKAGGKFAERSDFEEQGSSTAQGPSGSRQPNNAQGSNTNNNQASSQKPAVNMLVTDYSYEQYMGANWTDEGLVKAGLAEWAQPEPQAPAPNGPSSPGAPPPQGNMQGNPNLRALQGDLPNSDLQGLNM